jgi:hypothetical protein
MKEWLTAAKSELGIARIIKQGDRNTAHAHAAFTGKNTNQFHAE